MRDTFPEFYQPSADDERHFIVDGTVVVDANILLGLYELSAVQRNETLGVLEAIGDRLWIPYQVGLEYQRNRLGVIRKQAAHYTHLVDLHGARDLAALTAALSGITAPTEVTEEVRPLLDELARRLNDATSDYVSAAEKIRDRHVVTAEQGVNDDPVRKRLDGLFAGRVGRPPAKDIRERRISDAKRRREDQVPPGYKDEKKDSDERNAGDYLLWAEVLEHAESTVADGRPLLLVTNDTKEDWYAKSGGEPVGPRPELVREFHAVNPNGYHQVTLGDMLRLARRFLRVDVGDMTIEKASELSRPDFVYDDGGTDRRLVVDPERYGDPVRKRAALDRSVNLSLLVDLLRQEALADSPGAGSDVVRRRLMRVLTKEMHAFAASASFEFGSEQQLRTFGRSTLHEVLQSVLPGEHRWSDILDTVAIDLFLDIVQSYSQFEIRHPDEDR